MISHKHKSIFIHIPKTAGMSIENSFIHSLNLRLYAGQCHPLLLTYNKDFEFGPNNLAHLSAKDYTKFNYLPKGLFNEYYKFTIVRNPFDRMLSIYRHFQYHRYISFDTFLKYEFPKLEKQRYYFIKPQYEYIFDENGIQLVDFIGRFESLDKDIKHVSKNVSHSIEELKHINKSKKEIRKYSRSNVKFLYNTIKQKPYLIKYLKFNSNQNSITKENLSKEAKYFIENYYQLDFETFDYTTKK